VVQWGACVERICSNEKPLEQNPFFQFKVLIHCFHNIWFLYSKWNGYPCILDDIVYFEITDNTSFLKILNRNCKVNFFTKLPLILQHRFNTIFNRFCQIFKFLRFLTLQLLTPFQVCNFKFSIDFISVKLSSTFFLVSWDWGFVTCTWCRSRNISNTLD